MQYTQTHTHARTHAHTHTEFRPRLGADDQVVKWTNSKFRIACKGLRYLNFLGKYINNMLMTGFAKYTFLTSCFHFVFHYQSIIVIASLFLLAIPSPMSVHNFIIDMVEESNICAVLERLCRIIVSFPE